MAVGGHVDNDMLLHIMLWFPLLVIVIVASTSGVVSLRIRREVVIVKNSLPGRSRRLAPKLLIIVVAEKIVAAIVNGINGILGIRHCVLTWC